MQHAEYWAKRFDQLTEAQLNKGSDYYKALEKQYQKAINSLEKEIAKWYMRYATENKISLAEARRQLSGRELAEFKMTVEEYIAKGESLDPQWQKELETASARVHVSRLEALKLQMQQEIEKVMGGQADGIKELAQDIYTDGYYHTAFEIQKGTGIGFDLMKLDPNKVEKLLSRPWAADGKNFSERVWQNKRQLLNELENTLTQGIIRGQDPKKVIAEMSKRMQVSKGKTGRLIMTESAFFSSASQRDCFNDLDVEQYEIVATLDGHTSETCRSMDGKVLPMKDYKPGVTAPPFHVNCRSTTAPYFDDEFTVGEQRAARDEDGQYYTVPADMKYEDWEKVFVNGGSKKGILLQEFKPVNLGASHIDTINGLDYSVRKLNTSRYEAYVSDEVKLKPKQLHYFENNIAQALKAMGVKDTRNLPNFYIVSSNEMKTGALARFNAKENTLMIDVAFCDKAKLLAMQYGSACADNELSTAVHEFLHWKDAQDYIKEHGPITDQNKYIDYLVKKHRKAIEKLSGNGYNVNEISKYAYYMMYKGRFDEAYTEYRVKKILGR